MPTQFQLQVYRQEMGRASHRAWFEKQGHPCTISSQFVSMSSRICTIQFPPWARIGPAERDHLWMNAVTKDVLLILYVISIAQVTSTTTPSRGVIVSPGQCFNS